MQIYKIIWIAHGNKIIKISVSFFDKDVELNIYIMYICYKVKYIFF